VNDEMSKFKSDKSAACNKEDSKNEFKNLKNYSKIVQIESESQSKKINSSPQLNLIFPISNS
jgi:hypothetical protein